MAGKSAIAIIPARIGSKRIPKKNLRFFLDKPILAYSIQAASESGLYDEIMVSTDSDEIADLARKLGARVPFLRSQKNSDDHASLTDVVLEVLTAYKDLGREFKLASCLLPTAPFLNAENLISAAQLLEKYSFDSVFPVIRFSSPILRSFKTDENRIAMNWPEHRYTRSQDLAPAFYDAGQFYTMNSESFLKNALIFSDNSGYIELKEWEAQDIDTEEDWRIAEFKYSFFISGERSK